MLHRRARIRPTAARQYPAVEATHWYPAAILAHYVQRRDGPGPRDNPGRALSPRDFEFDGGAAREGAWAPSRRGEQGTVRRSKPTTTAPPHQQESAV